MSDCLFKFFRRRGGTHFSHPSLLHQGHRGITIPHPVILVQPPPSLESDALSVHPRFATTKRSQPSDFKIWGNFFALAFPNIKAHATRLDFFECMASPYHKSREVRHALLTRLHPVLSFVQKHTNDVPKIEPSLWGTRAEFFCPLRFRLSRSRAVVRA